MRAGKHWKNDSVNKFYGNCDCVRILGFTAQPIQNVNLSDLHLQLQRKRNKYMLLTLALVILGASIAVFFAQEFIGMFKKLFAIKMVRLFLPLLIASWLVYTFEYLALWMVYYYREILQVGLTFLINIMPFHQYAGPISLIILLFTITTLPVFLIDELQRKRTFKGYQYPNVTRILIFIVSSVLLLAL